MALGVPILKHFRVSKFSKINTFGSPLEPAYLRVRELHEHLPKMDDLHFTSFSTGFH